MKELAVYVVGFIFMCGVIYGGYYIAKNVSYSLFYEDMVEQTIQEQVQKKCLK